MSKKSILVLKQEADIAEQMAKQDLEDHGYDVKKIHRGADFEAINRKDPTDKIIVEVKLRTGKLSKLQKITKRHCKKQGIPYLLYSVNGNYFENHKEEQILNQTHNFINCTKNLKHTLTSMIRNPTKCPNCDLVVFGIENIIHLFGLRKIDCSIIREQSWCKKCRGRYS